MDVKAHAEKHGEKRFVVMVKIQIIVEPPVVQHYVQCKHGKILQFIQQNFLKANILSPIINTSAVRTTKCEFGILIVVGGSRGRASDLRCENIWSYNETGA